MAGHDTHTLWIVVAAIGGVALIALAILYRRAAARAELEEAERIIADHDREA